MKKVLSIFMLVAMFAIGINPSVAMHYCGKNFSSISLNAPSVDDKSCCHAKLEEQSVMDCGTPKELHTSDCCDTKNYQIPTDDHYQGADQQIDFSRITPSFENLWVKFDYKISLKSDFQMADEASYPPEGLHMDNLNILNLICIYRI